MADVKKGQFYSWMGCRIEIMRVVKGGKWALIHIYQGNTSWKKRQTLPLPDDAVLLSTEA